MEETWKDIPGYEGLYQASTMGRIASLNYYRGGEKKVMKLQNLTKGYFGVTLRKNGVATSYRVHRLIALTFLPNPNNHPIINHKDEDPQNNEVSNLEWCSYKYNTQYNGMPIRRGQTRRLYNQMNYHPHKVVKAGKGHKGYAPTNETIAKLKDSHCTYIYRQIDMDGNVVGEFKSSVEAKEKTGINEGRIRYCCRGLCEMAGGYKWERISIRN